MWIFILHKKYKEFTPRQVSVRRIMMIIPAFFLTNELQKMYFFNDNTIYKYLFLAIGTSIFFLVNMFFLQFFIKKFLR